MTYQTARRPYSQPLLDREKRSEAFLLSSKLTLLVDEKTFVHQDIEISHKGSGV